MAEVLFYHHILSFIAGVIEMIGTLSVQSYISNMTCYQSSI